MALRMKLAKRGAYSLGGTMEMDLPSYTADCKRGEEKRERRERRKGVRGRRRGREAEEERKAKGRTLVPSECARPLSATLQ